MAIRTAKKRPNKKAHATDPLMPHSNAYVPRSSPLLLALIPMARPKRKPKTAPQMSPSPIDGFIILSVRRHLDLLVVNSDVFFATIFSRPNQLFSLSCLSPFPFVGFVGVSGCGRTYYRHTDTIHEPVYCTKMRTRCRQTVGMLDCLAINIATSQSFLSGSTVAGVRLWAGARILHVDIGLIETLRDRASAKNEAFNMNELAGVQL
ncbi:hypothetical protein RUM44_009337 [Polyplax serrata]|uniref:Uncharacterized protein n=1 Tax=Polyplax serrata TaxID=468196 RepID=A0ABR1ASE4_POLSC